MKILVIQENGRHEANRHFRECFSVQRACVRLGHECDVWGLGHESFLDPIDFDRYDLLINAENYSWDWLPNFVEIRRPLKLNWAIDAHVRGVKPYRRLMRQGRFDLTLQATKDFVDAQSIWFPNCYDDELIHPLPDVKKQHRLGFCGNRVNRGPLLDRLTKAYGLVQEISVIGEAMVRAVNEYHIHFNRNVSNDINYRSFETLGCGTVLLTNWNPQYLELGFRDEVNCLLYRDENELCSKIEKFIDREEELRQIASRGQRLARQHTYLERVSFLLSYVAAHEDRLRHLRNVWGWTAWLRPFRRRAA